MSGRKPIRTTHVKVCNGCLKGVVVIEALEDHAPEGDNGGEDPVIPGEVYFLDGQLKLSLPEQSFECVQALVHWNGLRSRGWGCVFTCFDFIHLILKGLTCMYVV